MRGKWSALLVVLAVILFAWPAAAQQRQPEAGAIALGAEAGFYAPTQGLDVGASLGGLFEFYLTPRISIRATGGTAGTGYTGTTVTFRREWATADVVYNWEADLWHPFVVVGGGGYFVKVGSTWQSRPGLGLGGGIEYFARPNISIKLEALFRLVQFKPNDLTDPGGATLSVAMKRYF